MRLPYPMEAFDATTDYADHLCALPQSQKRSSRAIFSCHENQFLCVIPASLCLLFLPHLHANPTGTTGPARILRTLPRLPPCQPSTSSVDQSAEVCPYSTTVVYQVADNVPHRARVQR